MCLPVNYLVSGCTVEKLCYGNRLLLVFLDADQRAGVFQHVHVLLLLWDGHNHSLRWRDCHKVLVCEE